MPRPRKSRRLSARAPAPSPNFTPKALNSFLHHLGRTGSITFAATRAGLPRRQLYKRRAADATFAAQWEDALQLGIDRLQDDAMRRALQGTPRGVFRNGRQVGSVQQFDNRLLQFLLRAHRPQVYGDKKLPAAAPLPFDLVARVKAAEARMNAMGDRLPPMTPEQERNLFRFGRR